MEYVSIDPLPLNLKKQIWNFIHLKAHKIGRKKNFLRSWYSLCLALNRWDIHLINISNQRKGGFRLFGTEPKCKWTPGLDRTFCQAVVLLFYSRKHRVRHLFINKIKYFDSMTDFSEKHWRACKRGALPTEL